MRPRRHGAPVRHPTTVILGTAILGAVLVGCLATILGARTDPATAGTGVVAATRPSIRLVSLDPWVQSTDTVRATVAVSGLTATDRAGNPELVTTLYRPVPNRSSFSLTMQGSNLGSVVERFDPRPLSSTSSRVEVRFDVDDGTPTPPTDVETDDTAPHPEDDDATEESVTLTGPGVYPLRFTVEDADGTVATSMVAYLVRLADASTDDGSGSGHAPLRVSSEFRLQPTPTLDASGDAVVTPAAEQATTALVEGLADAGDESRRSFGYTVSPALVDALEGDHVTGATTTTSTSDTPTSDEPDLLTRLRAVVDGRDVQQQPWAPLDLATWLATPQLEDHLDESVTSGTAVLDDHLATTTRTIVDTGAWKGRQSDQSLGWFVDRGATSVLVPEEAIGDLDTSTFPRTLASPFLLDIGGGRHVRAMQLDQDLAAHFTTGDPTLGVNQLIADLSVIALDLPSMTRGMVVAPPPGRTPSADWLKAYTSALDTAHPKGSDALLAPTPLAETVDDTPLARAAGDTSTDGPELERTLSRRGTPAPRQTLGRQVATTSEQIDALATMQPGGPARSTRTVDGLRHRLAVATMPQVDVTTRNRHLDAITDQVDTTARSLRLPARQTITLTSDTASLPITIHRAADGPTRVVVAIDAPDRLHFPDGLAQQVTLDDPNTRLNLRVHSDSPGDTIVRLTITSPDGRLVAGTTELVVRSTAASGVGMVISFGSLAFLVAWWIRDIVRSRRRRRAMHVPPAELIDID